MAHASGEAVTTENCQVKLNLKSKDAGRRDSHVAIGIRRASELCLREANGLDRAESEFKEHGSNCKCEGGPFEEEDKVRSIQR